MRTKRLTSATVGVRIGKRKKMSMCAYFLDGWIRQAFKDACGERYVETMTDEELLHAFLQENTSQAEYGLFVMMLGAGDDLYKRETYIETVESYREWLQRSRQIDRIIN